MAASAFLRATAYALGVTVLCALFILNREAPLTGNHRSAQAETLMTGFFFCTEDPDILRPRIALRQNTDGIAIGEWPLFSYMTAAPCWVAGEWHDLFPKALSLLLLLIGGVFWGLGLVRAVPLRVEELPSAIAVMTFSGLALGYLGRPFPDSLAMALLGFAYWGWRIPGRTWTMEFFVHLAAVNAFAIRPILAPLLLVCVPDFKRLVSLGALCAGAYASWYLEWASGSTIPRPLPFQHFDWENAQNFLPQAARHFAKQTAQLHLNWVAIPLALLGARKRPGLFLAWLAAAATVLTISPSPTDLPAHAFLAPAWILLISCLFFFKDLSPWVQTVFTFAFVASGIAASHHHFQTPQRNLAHEVAAEMAALGLKPTPQTRIAVSGSSGNEILYATKLRGWAVSPEDRDRPCRPEVAAAFTIVDGHLKAELCSGPLE